MGRNKRGAKKKNLPVKKKKDAVPSITTAWTGMGVLESLPDARDIKIGKFSVQMSGAELIADATLELNHGRRYGLVGLNGTGKSTMLRVIGERQIPIPDHVDIHHLTGEVEAGEDTALEAVIKNVDAEVSRLEKSIETLTVSTEGNTDIEERLNAIYERLEELDADTATARAARLLHGLGFSKEMQRKKTKDFSGGWRMRIALAHALFISPDMLLLDEPTNHLDLEACVWLEEYLKDYNRILIVISHSQDFLNGVCTNIIHLQKRVLTYYTGNYDTYVRTRAELEENQMKRYFKEQGEIANIKDYVARFGHGSAKLARQAQSKQKLLDKMLEGGTIEKVHVDKIYTLRFQPVKTLAPPVLAFQDVSFGYIPGDENLLYRNLDFGVDLDSRIALVGPNGAGKSTLIKLMCGVLIPSGGMVRAHQHLIMGRYHQHLTEQLDVDLCPLEYMFKEFPDMADKMEEMRQIVGRFGITGKEQTLAIKYLSDGIKSRLAFAWLALHEPHILLLDEPTNHLDIETIDALADAINNFNGGMVLVSHDFRLIGQVAKEIWECKNGNITKWKGDIMEYKKALREEVMKENDMK